ncbi:RNA-directed DNA polymerase, eukaryota [Tanacetum coccineum]
MAFKSRSNADHTRLISKSIFITNFPDVTTSKDLWVLCQSYGTVVDVFIPNRKSKAGKRFAFVRFIKVDNVERLVGNLCTLWIRRKHLQANVARFDRDSIPSKRVPLYSSIMLAYTDVLCFCSEGFRLRPYPCFSRQFGLSMNSCMVARDLDNFGHGGGRGVPLHAWSHATFHKIGSQWGDVMELEDEVPEVVIVQMSNPLRMKHDINVVVNTINNEGEEMTVKQYLIFFGDIWGSNVNIMKFDQTLIDKEHSLSAGFTPEKLCYFEHEAQDVQGEECICSHHIQIVVSSRVFEDVRNLFNIQSEWKIQLLIISVYAPQSYASKCQLWDFIASLINQWNGECMVMGDFNEVRCKEDRWGSTFLAQGALFQLFGLDRHLSDHRPYFIREMLVDFGATPFWLYHSWLSIPGFDQIITSTWNSFILVDSNGMIRFKKKLQLLKKEIRGVTDDVLLSRMEAMKQLQEINSSVNCDFVQKAKVRWAIEGDENSKFFHGIINRKRANLSVKGIMIEGEWVDDPIRVKDEFRNHFADRFNDPGTRHGRINFSFPNRLTFEQVSDLETSVSDEEIRKAVWGCGENKSPGPDGFTFEFFRKFWTVVGPDFCIAVKWFFEHGFFAMDVTIFCFSHSKILRPETAFLPNRQILDGPFIINEILARCKHKNQQAMFFKVDFAKAYDSIRWDYLDDVLNAFGFGSRWRSWIQGSLNSGKASVLVNGSPTLEFQFHRGLKQETLGSFLCILIWSLFIFLSIVMLKRGIFKVYGLMMALAIFIYFYADEAIFIGDCHILGLGIRGSIVSEAAASLGCSVMKTSFNYLGIMVGGNMSLVKSWDETVHKLTKRLSKWKLKTLSIGGRLTLLKSVLGSTLIYNMSIFKVPKIVLNKMENLLGSTLVKSWDETVHKLTKRLSKWKLKTLSIGGRLTLLKSVLGSTLIYNMSIFKVPKTVLNKMENLRRNFFNGIQEGDRKITWVK